MNNKELVAAEMNVKDRGGGRREIAVFLLKKDGYSTCHISFLFSNQIFCLASIRRVLTFSLEKTDENR